MEQRRTQSSPTSLKPLKCRDDLVVYYSDIFGLPLAAGFVAGAGLSLPGGLVPGLLFLVGGVAIGFGVATGTGVGCTAAFAFEFFGVGVGLAGPSEPIGFGQSTKPLGSIEHPGGISEGINWLPPFGSTVTVCPGGTYCGGGAPIGGAPPFDHAL